MTPIANIKIAKLGARHGGVIATAVHGQYLHKNGHPGMVLAEDPNLAPGKELHVETSYAIAADGMPATSNMVLDHIVNNLAVFIEVPR
jgi:hypothetical protein